MAETFASKSSDEGSSSSTKAASKDRTALYYYSASLATVASVENEEFVIATGEKLFKSAGSIPDIWQLENM